MLTVPLFCLVAAAGQKRVEINIGIGNKIGGKRSSDRSIAGLLNNARVLVFAVCIKYGGRGIQEYD